MNEVSTIQNQLLSDIFNNENMNNFEERGLQIYQRNLRATSKRALEITYPTITALIGPNAMGAAGELLLKEFPPYVGNWSEWGKELHLIIENLEEFSELPYLSDIAKLDLAIHKLIRVEDSSFDSSSLRLLVEHSPHTLNVVLNQNFKLLRSNFPLVEIWKAHQSESIENREAHLAKAAAQMGSNKNQFILVVRPHNDVLVESITAEDYNFFSMIQRMSIGEAFSSELLKQFSFDNWLTQSLSRNIIKKVEISGF